MAESPCEDAESSRLKSSSTATLTGLGDSANVDSNEKVPHHESESIRSGLQTARSTNDFSKKTPMDLSDYFVGPRDINRHSKYPFPLRFCK
jgi:hypothetical protein